MFTAFRNNQRHLIEKALTRLEDQIGSDAALARACEKVGAVVPFTHEPIRAIEPFPSVVEQIAAISSASSFPSGSCQWQFFVNACNHPAHPDWKCAIALFRNLIKQCTHREVDFPIHRIDDISVSKSKGWTKRPEINNSYFRSIDEMAKLDGRPIKSKEKLLELLEESQCAPLRKASNHFIKYSSWRKRYLWQNVDGSHRMAAAITYTSESRVPYRFITEVTEQYLCADVIKELHKLLRVYRTAFPVKQSGFSFPHTDAARELSTRFGVSCMALTKSDASQIPTYTAIAVLLKTSRDRRVAKLLEQHLEPDGELVAFLAKTEREQKRADIEHL